MRQLPDGGVPHRFDRASVMWILVWFLCSASPMQLKHCVQQPVVEFQSRAACTSALNEKVAGTDAYAHGECRERP